MIVRRLDEAMRAGRRVEAPNWASTRLLLKSDGMGYSLHVTTIHPGTGTEMEYRNHLETVLCIGGEGTLLELATGVEHEIRPGVMYALDRHDRHVLRARTELQMVCVFNPPLIGREVHDETGAYPLDAEEIKA